MFQTLIETPLMERPTRTLVVVSDTKTLDTLTDQMERRGDVREVYKHPTNSNGLFISFYDIRIAETIYKEMKSNNLNVFYSISKYEIPQEGDKCDEFKNQGSVYITFRGNYLNENEFMNYLNEFGEIKEVKFSSGLIKCIEFYDARSSTKTREALNNKTYKGVSVTVRSVWDLNCKIRNEIYLKVEEEIKKIVLQENKEKKKKEISKKNEKFPFISVFDEFIMENIENLCKWTN